MRIVFLLAVIAICLAAPALSTSPSYRDHSLWTKTTRANPHEVINFRVALKQNNIDVLESVLLDVSNPKSHNYGKHWSIERILDLIAPEAHLSTEVVLFLEMHGAFNVENHRDYIKASARVEDIEAIFKVNMFNYKHVSRPDRIVRSGAVYTIPSQFRDLIHMVTGISELPHVKAQPAPRKLKVGAADSGIVIPQTIQNLYGIPTGYNNNKNTSLCLAEFQDDQSFNKKDLNVFATKTATPLITVTNIVGPYSGSDPDLESTLDVQYGGAIAETANVWFWTVEGWMYEFASDFFGTKVVPYVVSMSWGWPETLQCQSGVGNCQNGETAEQYVQRVNAEFIKIGLRGVTLLAASGDQGAPGDGDPECGNKKKPLSTIFPGASPYVTSVGATMLQAPSAADKRAAKKNVGANPPICTGTPCATSTTEIVCTYPDALITTGGGFSDYSPVPEWQQAQVSAYLSSGVPLPASQYFNSTNRGFPDVSALGHNYAIIASSQIEQVDGTSCSSPVFGAVVALLNSYRLNNNKPTLGFINPLLYSAPSSAFTDITAGDNKCTESCCSKFGFTATKGWDPVTGLGTPVFKNLLAYVQTLN
ncbi:Physaropepsin [Heterostelium album PN500]|uniref:Physaropepsin n=1 Tax=Heterostelium pallidum (strain ATCC 26659 / Pp 5 / PN500) TaxID=670386 RepID=D3B6M3_HETP5|nr:Physaropepsin [Heterostelium album PN500]EFA82993.1 Physaropepsin [Heterostelium album PN500]|eukprot:XP_020435110.1 Physaropepsin [Heterostelium album PN500]